MGSVFLPHGVEQMDGEDQRQPVSDANGKKKKMLHTARRTCTSALYDHISFRRILFSLCPFTIDGEWWGFGDGENKIPL